jgi:putative heme transporter
VTTRPRRGRTVLRTAVSAALIAAAFGFALPHVASYRSAWVSLHVMTWPHALLIAIAAAASMVSYWVTIRAVLPCLRLRQAAVLNLGSNAVANTLPAGGTLALGVSWAMLSSWGLNTADYILYTLVSGIWNVFALLGLPVLALLVMTTVRTPGPGLITGAAVGLALLATAAAGLGLLLRSQVFAVRAGHVLQRPVAMAARLAHRPPPTNVAGSLAGFRDRAGALLAVRGRRITVATVASNLTLWLVLLACLRGIGLSQAQVPWQTSLMAFAFIRLLTALPLTPGGVGITELGLVGILAVGAGHQGSIQVTAAVLLYRAITYLPPIPLGAIACLIWRHAPALIATSPPGAALTPARLNGPAPGSSGSACPGAGGTRAQDRRSEPDPAAGRSRGCAGDR